MMEKFNIYKPYLIIVLIPIALTVILGGLFHPMFIKDMPVELVDLDNTAKSRLVAEYLYDSHVIKISENAKSVAEAQDMLVGGRTCGVIVLPEGFGDNLQRKTGAKAAVYLDNTNFMFGNTIMSETSTIFETVKAGVQLQYLEAGDQKPYQAMQAISTMAPVDRTLYNPQLSYFYFLFPGLLALFTQQTYLVGTITLLVERKILLRRIKHGSTSDYLRAGFGLMATRFAVMGVLTIITTTICIYIGIKMNGMPMEGNIFYLMALQAAFLFATTGASLVIASIFEQIAHVSQFTMFLTIPTFLLSGYPWPDFIMSRGVELVMNLIWPLGYFAPVMKDIMLKGAGMEYILPYIIKCLIFGLFWITVGVYLYGRKIAFVRNFAGSK